MTTMAISAVGEKVVLVFREENVFQVLSLTGEEFPEDQVQEIFRLEDTDELTEGMPALGQNQGQVEQDGQTLSGSSQGGVWDASARENTSQAIVWFLAIWTLAMWGLR